MSSFFFIFVPFPLFLKRTCCPFFMQVLIKKLTHPLFATMFSSSNSADREVQRILLELLNQMDGFDQSTNVKVIMATNRQDTLDPALMRPGRLDRKIEFPLPDRRQKRLVFQACPSKMSLADEVDLEDFVSRPEKISGAEISAICQEAGLQAVRKNRYVILTKDFEEAYRKHVKKADTEFEFYK